VAWADESGARALRPVEARGRFGAGPVIVCHAALSARRLDLAAPPRSPELLDALELFAFVRPARFAAPSPAGLALALGLPEPRGAAAQAETLRAACAALLEEVAERPTPSREEALAQAETLGRAGWGWAQRVLGALRSEPEGRPWRGAGLDVWSRLPEWEDEAPEGRPGSQSVAGGDARDRLASCWCARAWTRRGPPRPNTPRRRRTHSRPRAREGEPRMVLAEAGTGVGKTLGYLAPASLWAERNGGTVWVSTYTRALQRQIERESHAVYPDPETRRTKAVVRKGRENYLCLLNYQEAVQAAQLGGGDLIGTVLVARWLRATRDGDMTGGDFPAWLPTLFSVGPAAQAGPGNLNDRRGECVHAACTHYRTASWSAPCAPRIRPSW
jgi:ATP-dependent DNA helicase DinG